MGCHPVRGPSSGWLPSGVGMAHLPDGCHPVQGASSGWLPPGDPDAPLLDAANYRYLSVYQEREMDGVTMLKGFTSIYRRET